MLSIPSPVPILAILATFAEKGPAAMITIPNLTERISPFAVFTWNRVITYLTLQFSQ